ncbi:MAG: ABC transporter substrate-binding protein [Rhodospirillales bacterium]|jgi:phospholipid transport system substrate-binding protein|nr:ABC transporter substrate-binding protein [Rhodospirillales bacterium]MDP6773425.1 ABC transporter substrate-binding protein [Rhodospirillales bacterium]
MMARRWLMAVLVACLGGLSAPAWAGPEKTSPDEAAKFITALSKETLSVLGARDASLGEREERVRQLLGRSIDLPRIGRFALGKAWPKATPEQRQEYQLLFAEWVLRTYSRRLGGYSGQSFKIIKAGPLGKRDAVVFTKIGRPSGPPLKAAWRVRGSASGYKILDVIVEGVSMIATQRSEFAALVRRQGVMGLIDSLRMQVTKFAARSS